VLQLPASPASSTAQASPAIAGVVDIVGMVPAPASK
jgi:hypothetical protein